MSDILQEILDKELKEGKIKDYDELMKRKAELQGSVNPKRTKSIKYSSVIGLLVVVILIVAAITFVTGGFDLSVETVDVSGDPVQTACSNSGTFTMDRNGDKYDITPVADYRIAARVVIKKKYTDDISAEIAPYDIGCVWGEVAKKKYDKYINYTNNDRTTYAMYYPGCPLSYDYVKVHVSNNHIIMSNSNMEKAVEDIKVGQYVILEGFLVNMDGNVKGQHAIFKTSLRRDDSGAHSCEYLYLKKVTIGRKVYE